MDYNPADYDPLHKLLFSTVHSHLFTGEDRRTVINTHFNKKLCLSFIYGYPDVIQRGKLIYLYDLFCENVTCGSHEFINGLLSYISKLYREATGNERQYMGLFIMKINCIKNIRHN